MTVLGVDLDGTEATNYTVSQPTGLDADISAKNLTINGAVADDKIYDGDDDATVDFDLAALQGVETVDQDPGEVVIDSSGYTATFDGPGGKNVGLDKPVTVLGVDLDGTEAANYTVSQPTGLEADISQLNTTASFVADDKVYDGDNSATTSTRTVTNEVSGDDVELAGDATFDNKNVGEDKVVTIETPSLSGTDALNYNLTTASTDTGRHLREESDNQWCSCG